MSKVEKENRINSLAVTFLERQQIQPNIFADQIIRGYKEGYKQAEKDLEPTLEDVEIILNAFLDLCIENNEQEKKKRYTDKEYCQEVLKRFKGLKHVK